MEIEKQLKNARTHSGLTQEKVAEEINVSRQTISNWENEGCALGYTSGEQRELHHSSSLHERIFP